MKQLRVLISRPDRIGDVALSTPIPREIKKKFPNSFVAVLLRPYTKDIYLNNPYVDAVIVYDPNDKNYDFFEKLKEIRKFKFTHALMLLPNEKINYMLFLAGIRHRVGVGYKFYQAITFTKSVSRHKYIPLKHEADYCMDLARSIGVTTDNLNTEIHLSLEEKNKVIQIRNELSPNGEVLIGVNSTSGNSAPNWNPERYYELIHKLKKLNHIKVIITDIQPAAILQNIEGVFYFNKDADLRTNIVYFAALDMLVSSSTGPMHIAAALKIKTVSLFCSLTACSPKLWGPLGNKSSILIPEGNSCNESCPDSSKGCRFDGKHDISCERVFNEILRLILE